MRISPQASPALACALRCLHSSELLAPLGFDSQGSDKMPYFLAVSLFKNKTGFTRPWHSCRLSLVTASFPGASASASGSPSRCTGSLLPARWQGPRGLPRLFPHLLPKLTASPSPLQPSWATMVHLSPGLLWRSSGRSSAPLPARGQGDGAKAYSRSCPPLLATL